MAQNRYFESPAPSSVSESLYVRRKREAGFPSNPVPKWGPTYEIIRMRLNPISQTDPDRRSLLTLQSALSNTVSYTVKKTIPISWAETIAIMVTILIE